MEQFEKMSDKQKHLPNGRLGGVFVYCLQQFLFLLPEPHGQSALRGIFGLVLIHALRGLVLTFTPFSSGYCGEVAQIELIPGGNKKRISLIC